jgi:hypothetical protein
MKSGIGAAPNAKAATKRAQELPDWFEMYNRIEPDVLEKRASRGSEGRAAFSPAKTQAVDQPFGQPGSLHLALGEFDRVRTRRCTRVFAVRSSRT